MLHLAQIAPGATVSADTNCNWCCCDCLATIASSVCGALCGSSNDDNHDELSLINGYRIHRQPTLNDGSCLIHALLGEYSCWTGVISAGNATTIRSLAFNQRNIETWLITIGQNSLVNVTTIAQSFLSVYSELHQQDKEKISDATSITELAGFISTILKDPNTWLDPTFALPILMLQYHCKTPLVYVHSSTGTNNFLIYYYDSSLNDNRGGVIQITREEADALPTTPKHIYGNGTHFELCE